MRSSMPENSPKGTKNESQDVNDEESGETSKLFAEVKKSTKEIIDRIKKELTAEEEKRSKLDEDYEKQKITISTIIENAIDVYNNYHSLSPEIFAMLEKYEPDYG